MPRTRPFPLLLTVLLAAAAWLATAGTAQAHTGLSSSTPTEGSTVTVAPTVVTLAFSGSVRGPELTVTGPDGIDVTTGDPVADGSLVSVPVAVSSSGTHTVDWAVTSADGHDLTGTMTFAVDLPVAGPGPDPVPPVTEASSTSAPTAAERGEPASATATAEAVEPSEAAAQTPEDGPNLLVTGTAAALALAVVAGAVLLVRRRRG